MQSSSKSSEKTATRSFRLNASALKALEEDAAKHSLSLNTLVNQIFLTCANHDRFIERMGYLKIPKASFRRILELVSDKDVADISHRSAEDYGKALILAKYGTVSLTAVLDIMRMVSVYGNFAEYDEILSPEGKRIITLMHNNGMKLSIWLSQGFIYLFEMEDIHPKITLTYQAAMIEF